MAFIDDLKNAIDTYATNNVKTEIVDFKIVGGGSVLNVGETFEFKVKVTNQSHLDMKNVKVRANGTSFADVARSSGPFGDSAVTPTAFALDAHQQHTTGTYRGKAKRLTGGNTAIVTAQVDSWDASLQHILNDYSRRGAAEGKLETQILQN